MSEQLKVVISMPGREEQALCEALRARLSPAAIAVDDGSRSEAQIAVVWYPPDALWLRMPALQLVISYGAGAEFLLDAPLPPRVQAARTVYPELGMCMARYVLAAMAVSQPLSTGPPAAQNICIVGFGYLGRQIAQALVRLGHRLLGYTRSTRTVEPFAVISGPGELDSRLGDQQVVINLLPDTPATRCFFDADRFGCFAADSLFINIGRGATVDEGALVDALARNRPGRAVLDVLHVEPVSASHPFMDHPQVVLTPHTAAKTDPDLAADTIAQTVVAWREGREPEHPVDLARGY